MPDFFSFFPYPFLIFGLTYMIFSSIIFSIQKKNIISNFKQYDSTELKNVNGTIIIENGYLRKNIEWCSFDLLINKNSIFLFKKRFYFIPGRNINLIFSNSDKKNTKRATLLREFKINTNNIELVYYPPFLMGRQSKIFLKNLNKEHILLLENTLSNKSRRIP